MTDPTEVRKLAEKFQCGHEVDKRRPEYCVDNHGYYGCPGFDQDAVNAAYIELDDAMGLAREREAELEAGLTAEIEEVTSLRQENTELERERAALQTQESNRTDTQWRSIVQGWRNKSAALQQQLTESKEREEQLKMELEQARDAVTTYKYTQSEGRDTV